MTAPDVDINAAIAWLLYDLAAIQESRQSRFGYQRAAHTILLLEEPITSLVQPDGSLPKIANVGPKSLRVVQEVLDTGASATVERAVRERGKTDEVAARRATRVNYLSFASVMAALRDESLVGPTRADYRGDFQMHTTWSDGQRTLREMADACVARGYAYTTVTDHARGHRIARGLSPDDLARQRKEIAAINEALEGRFRLLAGVEANIAPDGSIGLEPHEVAAMEVVVAAPHTELRSPADQTERMLRVVRMPGVHVLAHPRGRHRGERAGIVADWARIFAAAADARVAIEIDGDPARQDIDFELARVARDAGCLFALDSDAHAVEELVYSEVAIAHARLAGVPADRVINCWPLDRLLAWLDERRAGA